MLRHLWVLSEPQSSTLISALGFQMYSWQDQSRHSRLHEEFPDCSLPPRYSYLLSMCNSHQPVSFLPEPLLICLVLLFYSPFLLDLRFKGLQRLGSVPRPSSSAVCKQPCLALFIHAFILFSTLFMQYKVLRAIRVVIVYLNQWSSNFLVLGPLYTLKNY